MSGASSQIVKHQTNLIRQKFAELKTDAEIIRELNIPEQTFYSYKKRIQKHDAKLWDKVYLDSAKFRAVELIQLLDYTKNLCLKIAGNPTSMDKDRVEAAKTACEAQANIVKLLNEGPTFRVTIPQHQLKLIDNKVTV